MVKSSAIESPQARSVLQTVSRWITPDNLPNFTRGISEIECQYGPDTDALAQLLVILFNNQPMETVLRTYPTSSIYEQLGEKPAFLTLEQTFIGVLVCSVIAEGAMATKFGSGRRMIDEYGVEEVEKWLNGHRSSKSQLFNDKYQLALSQDEIYEAVEYLEGTGGWLEITASIARSRYDRQFMVTHSVYPRASLRLLR